MFLQKGYTASDFLVPFALDGHLEWFRTKRRKCFVLSDRRRKFSFHAWIGLYRFFKAFLHCGRLCIEMIYILHYTSTLYELFRNEIKWKLARSMHSLWMIHQWRTVQIGLKLGGVDRTRQSRQLHIQKRRRLRTWANKYHPRALSIAQSK